MVQRQSVVWRGDQSLFFRCAWNRCLPGMNGEVDIKEIKPNHVFLGSMHVFHPSVGMCFYLLFCPRHD